MPNFDLVYILVVFTVILLSMTLHEAMHAFVGYWLGDNTAKNEGRLTLNPIRHIDPFLSIILPLGLAIFGLPIFGGAKPVPFNPSNLRGSEWGAALVAIAGPLTNLFLAFTLFGIWALLGTPDHGFWGLFLTTGFFVNLGFFAFNILPIPPLDGSRVIYALAPEFIRRAMETMERYGLIIVFALVLLGGQYISAFLLGIINFILGIFSGIFTV